MKKPYRLHLRTLSPSRLREINERRELGGDESYLPFEEEVALMRGPERLEIWATHPDERVRAHLIAHHYPWICPPEMVEKKRFETGPERWTGIRRLLFSQVYQEAEREGVLWTPLIDRLMVVDQASQSEVLNHRLRAIAPCFRQVQELSEVRELFRFEAHWLRATLVKNLPRVDREMADFLVRGHFQEHYVAELAENPHLDLEMANHLARRALEYLEEEAARERPGAGGAHSLLVRLLRRGHRLSPELVRRWIEISPRQSRPPGQEGASRPGRSEDWLYTQLTQSGVQGLQEEHLLSLLPRAQEIDKLVELGRHPVAGVRLWKEVLPRVRSSQLRDHVANSAEARRDPELRKILLKSRSLLTMAEMAVEPDAEPEYVRGAIRRLLPSWPGQAARLLAVATKEVLGPMRRDEVAPLLEHADIQVRLAAIRALGEMRGEQTDGRSRERAGKVRRQG